eukprot:scaffold295102_cov21-Tisochrysis_lutea.AAC.1
MLGLLCLLDAQLLPRHKIIDLQALLPQLPQIGTTSTREDKHAMHSLTLLDRSLSRQTFRLWLIVAAGASSSSTPQLQRHYFQAPPHHNRFLQTQNTHQVSHLK